MKIPLYIPSISRKDKHMMLNALDDPQLTDGPRLRKFESKFGYFTKSKFSMGVSNGTSAIHLTLKALDIKKGDEVIVPDLTFIATANAVLHCGATPIPADIDSTLNISIKSIEEKITNKTKAIIPVHFAGSVCNIMDIIKIGKKNNIKIIEDCAHSLGAFFKNKHVGTFGIAGCFSFYPTKNITTIEGGMVITDSNIISKKITQARNHGLSKSLIERHMKNKPWIYDMKDFGYNFRLDEVRSSLGLSQLLRIKDLEAKRINAAKYYNKKLENVKGIETPSTYVGKNHIYHLYIIKINKSFGISRNKVHEKLINQGIFTTVHYKPIHKFSYFKKLGFKDKDYSSTMDAYRECLTLPLYPTIKRIEQDYIISNLLKLQK
ncbi:MAG: DegT/DnrJ/EryC1/StrS family aminotransferase [Nitrosopumilus sp.]|uniref:DegT/DnrJ/EryC1/StrS family aminotransferase n=1 Tax=Nitrosopumilus sp. TaxID=2024843 RepID=UPI00247D954A|nr:DegT/DnrJ/EryC1/StrS family aminotransferase [Nitrosopumilus sp.]MCV0393510.1 DegT/DnrJ/EryC1/StrS family aminotransferase [Nitrosopumilus sp.]